MYDEDNETFQTISKIGTGFSEELLKELHGQLKEQTIDRPPKYYRQGQVCPRPSAAAFIQEI